MINIILWSELQKELQDEIEKEEIDFNNIWYLNSDSKIIFFIKTDNLIEELNWILNNLINCKYIIIIIYHNIPNPEQVKKQMQKIIDLQVFS